MHAGHGRQGGPPLTAAIAAMFSLVHYPHDGRTPAATAWMLCAGVAVVLCATMLVSASLQAWRSDRSLYQPSRTIHPLTPPSRGPDVCAAVWQGDVRHIRPCHASPNCLVIEVCLSGGD